MVRITATRHLILIGLCFFISSCAKDHLTETQRLQKDSDAIVLLQRDLLALEGPVFAGDVAKIEIKKEVEIIAQSLVNQTRETNKNFKMNTTPIWHNFLIKMGVHDKGYCYHWVPELLKSLPKKPLKYFERHWGASFESMGRENNAVVITRRDAPFKTGLVYDAWRGVGRPFWKKIAEDKKYPWEQRFNEFEILSGMAKVEPK